jgi:hypothetical protein
MQMRDPTAKQNLITTARTHCWQTRNNTPGAIPAIQRVTPTLSPLDTRPTKEKCQSPREGTSTSPVIIIPPAQVPGGIRANARLVSQQALNVMTM